MARVAGQDGWIPAYAPVGATDRTELTPEILAEGVGWIRERRERDGLTMDGFDVVVEGTTTPDDADGKVGPWLEAGANWWLDADWSDMDPARVRDAAIARLTAGPPNLH